MSCAERCFVWALLTEVTCTNRGHLYSSGIAAAGPRRGWASAQVVDPHAVSFECPVSEASWASLSRIVPARLQKYGGVPGLDDPPNRRRFIGRSIVVRLRDSITDEVTEIAGPVGG